MPITRSRLLLTLGLGAAFIAWYLYWSSPGVQIPKTFARIREGVNESRANLIIDQLHPEYSIKRCWPNLLAEYGDLAAPGQLLLLARQGLQIVLRSHADDPLVMTYDIHRITDRGDGTYEVDVSMQLSTRSGHAVSIVDPPIVHKRFILARASSIFPALYIKSHEPLSANP